MWSILENNVVISLLTFAFKFGRCEDAYQSGPIEAAFWGIHTDGTALLYASPTSNANRFKNLTYQYRWTAAYQEKLSQVFNGTFQPNAVLSFVHLQNFTSEKDFKLCIQFLGIIENETCHRPNETLDFPDPFNLRVISRNANPVFSWKYDFNKTFEAISFEVEYRKSFDEFWSHLPDHKPVCENKCNIFKVMYDCKSNDCRCFYDPEAVKLRVRPCATIKPSACGKWIQLPETPKIHDIIEPPDFTILDVDAKKQLRIMNKPHIVTQSNLSLNCYYQKGLSYSIKYWGINDTTQPIKEEKANFSETLLELPLFQFPTPNTNMCVEIFIQDKIRNKESEKKRECKTLNAPPPKRVPENKTGLVIILILTMLFSLMLLAFVISKIKRFYNSIYKREIKMPKGLLEIIDEMETTSPALMASSISIDGDAVNGAEKIDPLVSDELAAIPCKELNKQEEEPCDETEAESTTEHNPSSSEIWRESLSLSDANISSSFHERLRIEDPLMYVRHAVSHNIIPSTLMESGSYKEQLKGHSYSELPIHKTALPPAVTWRRGKSEQGITNFKCNTKFSSIKSSKLDRRSSSLEKVNTGMRSLQKKQQSNHNEINNKIYHPLKNDGPDSVYQTTTNAFALPVNTIDVDSSAGNIESLCHEDLSNFVYTHVADNFSQKPIYRGNTNKLVPDDATMLINTKEQEKACVPQKIECNRPIHLLAGNDCFLELNSCQNTLSETLHRFSILRDGTSVQIINPTYTNPRIENKTNEIGCKMNVTPKPDIQSREEPYLKLYNESGELFEVFDDELKKQYPKYIALQDLSTSVEKTNDSSIPSTCKLSSLQQKRALKRNSKTKVIPSHQSILSPPTTRCYVEQDSFNLHKLSLPIYTSKTANAFNSTLPSSSSWRDCFYTVHPLTSGNSDILYNLKDSEFPIEYSSFPNESISSESMPVLKALTSANKDADIPYRPSCGVNAVNTILDQHNCTTSKRLTEMKERLLKTCDGTFSESRSEFDASSSSDVPSTSFTSRMSSITYDQNTTLYQDDDELIKEKDITEDVIPSDGDEANNNILLSSSYVKFTSLERVTNIAHSQSDKFHTRTET